MPVDCCGVEQGLQRLFGGRTARRDALTYRSAGLPIQSRRAVEFMAGDGVAGTTVLDIGFGVGGVHLELLNRGAAKAVGVEVSDAYLVAARDLAASMGHADAIQYHRGDFTQLAGDVPAADIVVLDRSMCCYPDWRALLDASIVKTRRFYLLVLPRDRWIFRLGARTANFALRLLRHPFRIYIHRRDAIEQAIGTAGLERAFTQRTSLWEAAVYEKATA